MDIDIETIFVNSNVFFSFLVPLQPSNLSIMSMSHGLMNTTFTFVWDQPPQGGGPESIVDNYTISITPSPPSDPNTTTLPFPPSPFIVTLSHNQMYTLSLTAVNCAGQSEALTIVPEQIGM